MTNRRTKGFLDKMFPSTQKNVRYDCHIKTNMANIAIKTEKKW